MCLYCYKIYNKIVTLITKKNEKKSITKARDLRRSRQFFPKINYKCLDRPCKL